MKSVVARRHLTGRDLVKQPSQGTLAAGKEIRGRRDLGYLLVVGAGD